MAGTRRKPLCGKGWTLALAVAMALALIVMVAVWTGVILIATGNQ